MRLGASLDDWSGSRLQKPPPDPELEAALAKTFTRGGRPANIFVALGNHPKLMERFNALGGQLLRRGVLPADVREIAILRVAARTGSEYEFAQHALIAREVGVTDDVVKILARGEVGDLSPEAALACRVADNLLDSDDVHDDLWAEVENTWDVPARVELLVLVGFYRMVAAFLRSVRVPLDPGLGRWPGLGGQGDVQEESDG